MVPPRPRLLLAAVLLTMSGLAACGSDEGDEASGAANDSKASNDPGVVVALDDFATVHLLSLGITPDVAVNAFSYPSTAALLEGRDVETYDYGAELSIEKVAAAKPDVIVGVSLPTTADVEKELDAIAPTTVFDFDESWDAQLGDVAQAVGRSDEAAEIVADLQNDIAALATEVEEAGESGKVASVIAGTDSFFSPPLSGGVGQLLEQVGLDRPEAQKAKVSATNPFITISAERLADHDGDQIFVLAGKAYDPAPLEKSPLWPTLEAVKADKVSEVSAELWLGTSAFSVDWVIDDLRAVLVEGSDPAPPDDAAVVRERFDELADTD